MIAPYQSRHPTFTLLAVLLPPLALTGCLGLSDGSELIVPEASGPAPTQITIGRGQTPTYSWRVGEVSSIFVVRTSDPTNPVWGINAQGAADIISSPVVHGTTSFTDPNLQLMSGAELTLTDGVEYRVCISTQGGFKQYCTAFFTPDGTSAPTTTPGSIPTGSLAASTHSLALQRDGTAWAWGANANGQIGDGQVGDTAVPLAVTGLSDVAAIASGGAHSLAVTNGGTVWSWGANGSGQLGDGDNADSAVPLQVPGLHDITAVAAGDAHSLALDKTGRVWAWGENSSGQLGDGTTVNRNTPVQVAGLSDIVAIAAGKLHSMALARGGTLWSWGGNYNGQLGNGTVASSTVPIPVNK